MRLRQQSTIVPTDSNGYGFGNRSYGGNGRDDDWGRGGGGPPSRGPRDGPVRREEDQEDAAPRRGSADHHQDEDGDRRGGDARSFGPSSGGAQKTKFAFSGVVGKVGGEQTGSAPDPNVQYSKQDIRNRGPPKDTRAPKNW